MPMILPYSQQGVSSLKLEQNCQQNMALAERSLHNNKLALNTAKVKCTVSGISQKLHKVTEQLNIQAGKDRLEDVKSFKYLGLWLDESLRWSDHLTETSNKVAPKKWYGLLVKVQHFHRGCLTFLQVINIPDTRLWQCNMVYGPKANMDRMQRLQNCTGRVVLRCHRIYNSHIL